MSREYSLLRRLEQDRSHRHYTTQIDKTKVLSDIGRNVQEMLNVRMGSVMALDDYGMPDFNDVVKEFPDAVTRIRTAIKRFVDAYEPRLQKVSVHHLHDPEQPLLLKFAIHAELKADVCGEKVRFNTVLTGNGQATVRV